MTKLKYKLTNDILFKMLFVNHRGLLKKLVSALLGIPLESISEFEITNPEILDEAIAEKFCRLDINMTVDGMRVDLEVQVKDEKDYPERSLYYWAKEYSSALNVSEEYESLPRVIVASIVKFRLFDCDEYHSEFRPLEVTRHTPLTDRMSLHYFELCKLPDSIVTDSDELLWLSLLKATTEEELRLLEDMEVPEMTQAISAYRAITADKDFKELERLRDRARHNEAAALANARRAAEARGEARGRAQADKELQMRVAELEAELAKYKSD